MNIHLTLTIGEIISNSIPSSQVFCKTKILLNLKFIPENTKLLHADQNLVYTFLSWILKLKNIKSSEAWVHCSFPFSYILIFLIFLIVCIVCFHHFTFKINFVCRNNLDLQTSCKDSREFVYTLHPASSNLNILSNHCVFVKIN